jgi:hypothetical protein
MLGDEALVSKSTFRSSLPNRTDTCDCATFRVVGVCLERLNTTTIPINPANHILTSSHPHLNRLVMADALEYSRHEGEKDEEEEEEEIDDTVGTMLV